ncbi:MAG: glutathione S-transferase family protein [Alphaproteobacteria bacterium]|nr:glutathione S-transferase family protein [Alphaproteobacteria bacterium]
MHKLILWGRNTSVNVQKVIWTLAELGLDYERKDVGGDFGGLDSPDFAAMNPNRLIPVLQDGDLSVWESSAIVRYLAAQYGAGTLWPELPRQRAQCDQWADWYNTTFQPTWLGVYLALVLTPPSRRDMEAIRRGNEAVNKGFALLDGALAGRDFLCGKGLTYADILCGAVLYRWSRLDVERIDMPNVDAWHARLRTRPAFVTGIEIDFSAMMARD